MITTSIPRDIRKFKTKFALGLTFREFVCFVIASVVAIAIYNVQKIWTATPEMGLCGFCVIPLAFGFIPEKATQGMTLEKYIKATFVSNYLSPKVRVYKRANPYRQFLSYNIVSSDAFDKENSEEEWARKELKDLDKKEKKAMIKEKKVLAKEQPEIYQSI